MRPSNIIKKYIPQVLILSTGLGTNILSFCFGMNYGSIKIPISSEKYKTSLLLVILK